MFDALIRSHNTRQIVVQSTADGVVLPKFPGVDFFPEFKAVVGRHVLAGPRAPEIMNGDTEEQEWPLTLVFINRSEYEKDERDIQKIAVLDSTNVNDFPVAQTYSWMELQDAFPILRAGSYSRSMLMTLEDALNQSLTALPPPGYPYFCRKYRGLIRSWAADSLKAQGATLAGPLTEQTIHGDYMLLKGHTDKASFYCKLVHPSVKEAAITAMIHRLFPDLVVTPVAIDETRNVMLSWDFGITCLDELEEIDGLRRIRRT